MNEDTLHELPKGWGTATISQLVDKNGVFIDGDWVESKDQDPSGDVRLVQLADIGDGVYRNKSNRFLTFEKAVQLGCTFLKTNDVLIARMPDPLGRACLFPGDPKPCITVVDVCIVRLSSDLTNNHWLMHAINSPVFRSEIANLQSGSTRMRISRGNLSKLELPLPPLPEQRLIAMRVDSLLEHVRKAKESLGKIPQIMKRFRQAALKKAFSGELTAEWRAQQQDLEPAAELLKRIQEEQEGYFQTKSERQKQSKKRVKSENESPDTLDLPELPEGWVWTKLGQIIKASSERVDPNETPNEPYIGLEHIESNTTKIIAVGKASEVRSTKSRFRKGDILYGKLRPYLNKACIPDFNGVCSTDILVFKCPSDIENKYLLRFVTTNDFVAYANQNMSGIQHPRISLDTLEKFSVPLPPLPEQQEIIRRIESLFKFADGTEKNAAEARKRVELMTQSILARAFRGDLSADFREAVRNWKDLDAEARGRYVFMVPEEERERVLDADEFPMETAGQLLERIREEREKSGWKSRRKNPL